MKKYKMTKALLTAVLCMSSALFGAEKASVKPNGCKGPVLCSSYPIYEKCNDCCDYRWHLDIGLLYQQPWMTDMIAGATRETKVYKTDGSENRNTYRLLENCFDYSLGVVAGIGYYIDHDSWFLGIDFDWLSATKDTKYDDTMLAYITITPQFDSVTPSIINYHASLDIYDLGFHLSRGSYHSKDYSLEPIAGVKALWVDGTNNREIYSSSQSLPYVQNNGFTYWGVGPMFGLNAEYYLCGGLSIFSDSNIAVLYGEVSGNIVSENPSSGSSNAYVVDTQKVNFNQPYFVPIRTILGLKLGTYCLNDRHYVAVKIGYDARYILANTGLNTVSPTAHTDPNSHAFYFSNPDYSVAANGLYVDFLWDF